MAELEIHHESEHAIDPKAQRVGVLAAVLAVLLAVVTIASRQTHTEAIIHKSTPNDHWAHYQSSRLKYHNLELGQDLIQLLGPKGASTDAVVKNYHEQRKKYEEQAKEIQDKAKHAEEMGEMTERRAMRFDFGEGLLEIGLVLTSLYFISRKMMFPVIGMAAAVAGILFALTAIVLH